MPNHFDRQWQQKEQSARHGVAIFLTLFSLIALDTVFTEDKDREKRSRMWTAWGITFVLLAFFIITPEQEALQSMLSQA